MQTIVENPVGQSCSGFAQARTIVIGLKTADRPAHAPLDTAATGNVIVLQTTHRMMEVFETAGRAARAALVDEANALVTETLALTVSAFQVRTLSDLLDLQGNFARRRFLAAATLASTFMATSVLAANDPAMQKKSA